MAYYLIPKDWVQQELNRLKPHKNNVHAKGQAEVLLHIQKHSTIFNPCPFCGADLKLPVHNKCMAEAEAAWIGYDKYIIFGNENLDNLILVMDYLKAAKDFNEGRTGHTHFLPIKEKLTPEVVQSIMEVIKSGQRNAGDRITSGENGTPESTEKP